MNERIPINSYVAMIAGDEYDSEKCVFSQSHNDRKYVIPVYQRPYSWVEKNIDDFLQTIMNGFNNNCEMKFFGTMQFNVGDGDFQIVDGQQRLTTMILFVHILDLLSERSTISEYGMNICNNNIGNADNELNKVLHSTEIGAVSKNRKGKADISEVLNIYDANSRILKTKFQDYYSDSDKNAYSSITCFANAVLNYVLSGLYVVVLETRKGNLRLPEIVDIFNTINTTGMALDDSDIFKLQYFDYLNRKNPDIGDGWMEKIKECYDVIENYNSKKACKDKIGMPWILDIYKHCICAKYELKFDQLSKSNERFFDDLFKNPEDYEDILMFECFQKVVVSFVDFWTKLQEGTIGRNVFQTLSVQLIDSTRYSRYRTLPFVYSFFNLSDDWDNTDNEEVYNDALEITFAVIRLFIVNSVNFAKVINPVQSIICNNILPMISNKDGVVEYIDEIIWDSPYSNDKKGVELAKGWLIKCISKNSFYNTKVGLMCLLLAIKAEIDMKHDLLYIKEHLFNWDENPYDIEHILSKSIFENSTCYSEDDKAKLNGLGNLVILERDINRAMGRNMVLKPEEKESPNYYQKTQYSIAKAVIPNLKQWDMKTVEKRCEDSKNTLLDLLSHNA